jgi:hypothetical protein
MHLFGEMRAKAADDSAEKIEQGIIEYRKA